MDDALRDALIVDAGVEVLDDYVLEVVTDVAGTELVDEGVANPILGWCYLRQRATMRSKNLEARTNDRQA